MLRVSGLKHATKEFEVKERMFLGDLLRMQEVEVNGGTLTVDGITIAASSIDTHPIGPGTKNIEISPSGKGGLWQF